MERFCVSKCQLVPINGMNIDLDVVKYSDFDFNQAVTNLGKILQFYYTRNLGKILQFYHTRKMFVLLKNTVRENICKKMEHNNDELRLISTIYLLGICTKCIIFFHIKLINALNYYSCLTLSWFSKLHIINFTIFSKWVNRWTKTKYV